MGSLFVVVSSSNSGGFGALIESLVTSVPRRGTRGHSRRSIPTRGPSDKWLIGIDVGHPNSARGKELTGIDREILDCRIAGLDGDVLSRGRRHEPSLHSFLPSDDLLGSGRDVL